MLDRFSQLRWPLGNTYLASLHIRQRSSPLPWISLNMKPRGVQAPLCTTYVAILFANASILLIVSVWFYNYRAGRTGSSHWLASTPRIKVPRPTATLWHKSESFVRRFAMELGWPFSSWNGNWCFSPSLITIDFLRARFCRRAEKHARRVLGLGFFRSFVFRVRAWSARDRVVFVRVVRTGFIRSFPQTSRGTRTRCSRCSACCSTTPSRRSARAGGFGWTRCPFCTDRWVHYLRRCASIEGTLFFMFPWRSPHGRPTVVTVITDISGSRSAWGDFVLCIDPFSSTFASSKQKDIVLDARP